jgi:hypothetical protein
MVGDRVKELARTAVDAVSGAVKENIRAAVPELLGAVADRRTNAEPDAPPFAARFDARRAQG